MTSRDEFIAREEDEICRFYTKMKPYDFLGVWGTELMTRIPFQKARPFLSRNNTWTEESWKRIERKRDRVSLIGEMEDYFQDAVEKCNRHTKECIVSLDMYRAWTWLLKDMDVFEYLTDDRNFTNFGAPMIQAVMEKYDFKDLLPDNNFQRLSFLNMAKGQKCNDLCVRGCTKGNPTPVQKKLIMPNPEPAPAPLILPK